MKIILTALASLTLACGVFAADKPPSLTPVSRPDQKWWLPRHEEKTKAAAALGEKCKVVFLGDSITQGFEGGPHHGRYAALAPLFLGFSGDRTQHVLWRLDNGEWPASLRPAAAVIMIGTNNTGAKEPPAQTAEGVAAVVDAVHARSPKTTVILFAVFPRGATAKDPLRLANDEVNKTISGLKSRDYVRFVDIGAKFLNDKGDLPKSLMPDLLHPNGAGQKVWADAIDKELKALHLL